MTATVKFTTAHLRPVHDVREEVTVVMEGFDTSMFTASWVPLPILKRNEQTVPVADPAHWMLA